MRGTIGCKYSYLYKNVSRIDASALWKAVHSQFSQDALGCDENSRAFVVRDLSTSRVYTTADLECVKSEFPYRAKVPRAISGDEYKIPEHQFEDLEPEGEPDDERNDEAKMDETKAQDEGETEGIRRSRRRREPSSQALRNIAHD